MKKKEIIEMLDSVELPYAYYQFPERDAPALPYMIYWFPYSDNFSADNKNYSKIYNMHIELYTKDKDFEQERTVEKALNEHDFFYRKSEDFLKSEDMYMVLYETFVLIEEEED